MGSKLKIENVILPTRDPGIQWDIQVEDDVVQSIRPSVASAPEQHAMPEPADFSPADLLLPSLCHPHVHLDKAYLLTCHWPTGPNHPGYSDLMPQSGSFGEALVNTSRAKERYTSEDLYLRGSQLLATSYTQGITSLRAFVEVDHITGLRPLHIAERLRDEFSHLIEMQICVFAQEPLFSPEYGGLNRETIYKALDQSPEWADALGTTPYVEQTIEDSVQNIKWAIEAAIEFGLHLDFHLDYNLDPPESSTSLIYTVINLLEERQWTSRADRSKTIMLGHCTQLSTFSHQDLLQLAQRIKSSGLPIYFVGLPTSDLYMMGRESLQPGASLSRPRGTLQVPSLIKDYGLEACLGINNVGNAFTPYGTGDLLQLASWGVGIYHAGTAVAAKLLYSCVSWRARQAIGLKDPLEDGDLVEGRPWQPMLLIRNRKYLLIPGQRGRKRNLRVLDRPRLNYTDVVWDPPDTYLRSIIGRGGLCNRGGHDDESQDLEDSYALQYHQC